jgi:hypothetical protein
MSGIYNFVVKMTDQVSPAADKMTDALSRARSQAEKLAGVANEKMAFNAGFAESKSLFKNMAQAKRIEAKKEAALEKAAAAEAKQLFREMAQAKQLALKTERDAERQSALESRKLFRDIARERVRTEKAAIKEVEVARKEALKREKIAEREAIAESKALFRGRARTEKAQKRQQQGGLIQNLNAGHSVLALLGGGGIAATISGFSALQDTLKGATSQAVQFAVALGGVYVAFKAAEFVFDVAKAGAKLAIESGEAKQAMTSLFDTMGEGQSTGAQAISMFDRLGRTTGMTRAEIAPLARDFEAMGKRSIPELQSALTAAATAMVIGGEAGAEKLKMLEGRIQSAKEAGMGLKIAVGRRNPFAGLGVDLDDVSKKMGVTSQTLAAMLKKGTADADKFGKALESAITEKGASALARHANNWTSLTKRLSQNFSELFDDIAESPGFRSFIDSFERFVNIFSSDKASGSAMKEGLTSAFSAVFNAASGFFMFVKNEFLDMEIAVLDVQIELIKLSNWFAENAKWFTPDGLVGKVVGAVRGEDDAGAGKLLPTRSPVAPMLNGWETVQPPGGATKNTNLHVELHIHGADQKTASQMGEESASLIFEHLQLSQGV